MRRQALVAIMALAAGCRGGDSGELLAFGTVEAQRVSISSRTGGKVESVEVQEGDRVRQGDRLVRLDLRELEQQRARAEAAARAAAAREQLLQEGAQREDVVAARRGVDEVRVRDERARRELARTEQLAAGGALAPKELDLARDSAALAANELARVRAELAKLLGGARSQELAEAEATRQQAEASVRALDLQLEDAELEAPIDGVVLHRLVEPGEVIRPSAPLLELGDVARPYVDVYVPEPQVGRARPGTEVVVRPDAWPDRPFRGVIRSVAEEAEFTPKNVQTADQRARLVFRVRVDVEDPDRLLHPGMPASVTIPPAAGPAEHVER